MGNDDEIRDFWMKSLFEQVGSVPLPLRSGYRWRMSIDTMNLLRTLSTPIGYCVLPLPPTFDVPELLLGYPIDLDESAEGATFEPAEAVSRG